MPSDFTSKVEIDGKEYQFQLLSLADALEVESKITALVAQTMGKGEKDHRLLYQIGKQCCIGLCVDDFEVKSVDDHFRGQALLFNKVIIKGVTVNFPDFFSLLEGLGDDSEVKAMVRKSGLASAL